MPVTKRSPSSPSFSMILYIFFQRKMKSSGVNLGESVGLFSAKYCSICLNINEIRCLIYKSIIHIRPNLSIEEGHLAWWPLLLLHHTHNIYDIISICSLPLSLFLTIFAQIYSFLLFVDSRVYFLDVEVGDGAYFWWLKLVIIKFYH